MSELSFSPTVYGIETEYSCMITLPGNVIHELVGSCHSVDEKLGLYQQPHDRGSTGISEVDLRVALKSTGLFSNGAGMLSNGGRLYIDPSGPEYATPETSTAQEAVLRSFDGDEIVLKVFDFLRVQGVINGYQINRRVVDHNRTSRGIHLNTTTSLNNRDPKPLVQNWIAALNVAKGAIFGSGGLLVDGKGETAYHHSPRLSVTSHLSANYQSYSLRPLVRVPFKEDSYRLSRIETVTSDALNFAWPLRASLVATNSLIKIIELGFGNKLPQLSNPIHAAQAVGLDGYNSEIQVSKEGYAVSVENPLCVIREICEVILEVDSLEGHLDVESSSVIREIIEVVDKMTVDVYSVANQVESIARLVAMQRKMDKCGLALDSETMCRFDYAWDWLGGGIAETLRNKTSAGWQGFKSGVEASRKRRVNIPPQDTRAKIRGDMIKKSDGFNSSEWQNIFVRNKEHIFHPLQTHIPKEEL